MNMTQKSRSKLVLYLNRCAMALDKQIVHECDHSTPLGKAGVWNVIYCNVTKRMGRPPSHPTLPPSDA